jgi:hypothetical protein
MNKMNFQNSLISNYNEEKYIKPPQDIYFLLSKTAASGGGAGWFVKAQMRLLV